jgi:hypothetical protein
MNLPRNERELRRVRGAFDALRHDSNFQEIMGWIKNERDKLDSGNRIVGQENKISGAYALSMILDEHDASGERRAL